MLVIKKGKIVKSIDIELSDGKVIKSLQEGESYKYLRILGAKRFLKEEMKLNVSKKYFRRLKKVLKSKLNGGNLVQGVNAWAVSLSRYSVAFISCRKCELQAINRKGCLQYMEDCTQILMFSDCMYLEKMEGEV